MKAAIGTVLIVLFSETVLLAQSPGYSRAMFPLPSLPSAPPALPPLPSFINHDPAPTGAQSSGAGGSFTIPKPALPTLPSSTPADKKEWVPDSPDALNAPYEEPFELPLERDDVPHIVEPLESTGADCAPCLWMSADYLFWWTKRASQRDPLVVTGPPSDAFPGALDQPHTGVLFGGKGFSYNPFSGLHLNGGIWFGSTHRLGLELGGFFLEEKSAGFRAAGDARGQPFIARPFVNALTGNENVYFVSQNFVDPASTALMTGGVAVSSTTRMGGFNVSGLANFYRDSNAAITLIGGFRSLVLRERLRFDETLRNLDPAGALTFGGLPVDPTNTVTTFDRFVADNNFYGGQLGTRVHLQFDRLFVDVTAKASMGVTEQIVTIDGASSLFNANGKIVGYLPGGVLAQTSNMGRHFRSRLGFVPEGNIDLGYELAERIILKVGYSFIGWNSVIRSGNVIDRTINPHLVPTDADFGIPGGPARPGFQYQSSTFWAQGISLGLEFRF